MKQPELCDAAALLEGDTLLLTSEELELSLLIREVSDDGDMTRMLVTSDGPQTFELSIRSHVMVHILPRD